MRRIILVVLVQVLATVFILASGLAVMSGPFTSVLLTIGPVVVWSVLLLFPLGVILHWVIAKKMEVYPGWAYWAVFVVSILMLPGIPIGTIAGGTTIWILHNSETFQKMRNGNQHTPHDQQRKTA